MSSPLSPDQPVRHSDPRSVEPLDGALSQLYMEGRTLTIQGRLCPDFRSAMIAILAMTDAELPAIAKQIADGLRNIRVTCELNKPVWRQVYSETSPVGARPV